MWYWNAKGEVFEDGGYRAAVTPNWSDLARAGSGMVGKEKVEETVCGWLVVW